ncbi:MAG: CYTH domain-containing protein [Bradymonadaceae bacterium]|nr:CYTH domain-containing protein [Lujinxingiaceae bacterium]
MAQEIERKFLVKDTSWQSEVVKRTAMRQGYIDTVGLTTVRVRLQDDQAYLTIKGATRGISRSEFEYAIPCEDAVAMLDELCEGRRLEKVRHLVAHGAHCWEIDVFEQDNAGLVVAEIELARPDEHFERPEWLGEEVSDDPRYYNANLVSHPYARWAQKQA